MADSRVSLGPASAPSPSLPFDFAQGRLFGVRVTSEDAPYAASSSASLAVGAGGMVPVTPSLLRLAERRPPVDVVDAFPGLEHRPGRGVAGLVEGVEHADQAACSRP